MAVVSSDGNGPVNLYDGLIEEISLKNFMCHSELKMDNLAPYKISFITGPNGSGKSAVLTALMLGFGGRATITCRGHSTKGFVKEGKPFAEILIKLRNCTNFGRYQFEKFGNAIFIKRRIHHSGTSEYHLLNERNATVYKTAGELKKLTNFFDIRVENPLMFLTQENAKKLLFDAGEKEMYKFFVQGTGIDDIQTRMSNLAREIGRVRQNWALRRDSHEKKKKEIESLKRRYNRYREVDNFQQREVELVQSLQWFELAQKEKELVSVRAECDKVESQCTVISRKKDEAQRTIENVQKTAAERAELVREAIEEVTEAKNSMKSVQSRRAEAIADMKKVEGDIQYRKKRLNQLVGQKNEIIRSIEIAKRKQRDKEGADVEKQQSEKKLEDLRRRKVEFQDLINKEQSLRDEAQQRLSEIRSKVENLRQSENNLRRELDQLARQRSTYENVKANSIARFGRHMPLILREVENAVTAGRFQKPPIGPLGRYISIKGDESWAPAVEAALGKPVTAFLVSCAADRDTMHDVLRNRVRLNPRNPNEYPQVISSDRPFGQGRVDCSRNQARCPGADILNFFDLAEITDDDVYNILLELTGVETKLFIEDVQDAFDLLHSGRCQQTLEVIGKNVDRIRYFPNSKATNFDPNRRPCRANYLMKDVQHQMLDVREKESSISAKLQTMQPQIKQAVTELQQLESQYRSTESSYQQASNKLRGLEFEIERVTRLISTVIEEPNDTVLLEEDLQRKDEEIAEFQSSQEQVVLDARLKAAEDQFKKVENDLNTAKQALLEKERLHELSDQRASEVHRSVAEARRKLPAIRDQYDRLKTHLDELKTKLEEKELECKAMLQQLMTNFGERPRMRSNASRREIEQQIEDLRDKIADRERIDKTGFDDIPLKQKVIDQEHRELTERNDQLLALESIVQRRIDGHERLKSRTAERIQAWFHKMSCSKELNNQLKFDHTNGTLGFKVSSLSTNQSKRRMTTGSQPSTSNIQQGTTRSIKTLSGGERSMSTVFFLLSLWENSESPFKGMDEFDVFLDGENREAAISLIATFSQQMTGQFFLLSPCNVSSISNNARNQVIVLKKAGGIRGSTFALSLSQGAAQPSVRKRRSRMSLSQHASSSKQNNEESDEEKRSRRGKRPCTMEPKDEEGA